MSRLLEKMRRDQENQMYGDNKLGHRVTGEKSPFAKIVEPPPVPGDHVKIERNADGRIVGVVVFLMKEAKSRVFHIDEIRALRFISDPSLIEDSPEDFLHSYGPGLIDMARFRHRKEEKSKAKAKAEASEGWMTDDQREVMRSLGE
jgi:hypothetical protein